MAKENISGVKNISTAYALQNNIFTITESKMEQCYWVIPSCGTFILASWSILFCNLLLVIHTGFALFICTLGSAPGTKSILEGLCTLCLIILTSHQVRSCVGGGGMAGTRWTCPLTIYICRLQLKLIIGPVLTFWSFLKLWLKGIAKYAVFIF